MAAALIAGLNSREEEDGDVKNAGAAHALVEAKHLASRVVHMPERDDVVFSGQ